MCSSGNCWTGLNTTVSDHFFFFFFFAILTQIYFITLIWSLIFCRPFSLVLDCWTGLDWPGLSLSHWFGKLMNLTIENMSPDHLLSCGSRQNNVVSFWRKRCRFAYCFFFFLQNLSFPPFVSLSSLSVSSVFSPKRREERLKTERERRIDKLRETERQTRRREKQTERDGGGTWRRRTEDGRRRWVRRRRDGGKARLQPWQGPFYHHCHFLLLYTYIRIHDFLNIVMLLIFDEMGIFYCDRWYIWFLAVTVSPEDFLPFMYDFSVRRFQEPPPEDFSVIYHIYDVLCIYMIIG